MRKLGILFLSFYLGFPCAHATPEGDLDQMATVLMEDRKLVQKIIFKTLFHQIVERSLLLKELAGEKSKEEMADTWRSTKEVSWRRSKEDTWGSTRKVSWRRTKEDTWRRSSKLSWKDGRGVRIM